MPNVNVKKIIFFSVLGLLVVGTGVYLAKQFKLLKDSCWAFSGALIKSLSLSKVELTIMLKILNRSAIDILVRSQKYNIYIGDILVSKIARTVPITIKGKSSQSLSLDVMFVPKDLLKAGWQSITDIINQPKKIMITIKGELSLKSGLIAFKTVNIETKMSLQEMIDMYNAPDSESCKAFKESKT